MTDLECERLTLDLAMKDARALAGMLDVETFSEEVFGFHLQQAVEKAPKAWIAILGGTWKLTQDMEDLADQIQACGADTADLDRFRELTVYTPYAVEFRYSGVNEWTRPIGREATPAGVVDLLEHVRALLESAEDAAAAGS